MLKNIDPINFLFLFLDNLFIMREQNGTFVAECVKRQISGQLSGLNL